MTTTMTITAAGALQRWRPTLTKAEAAALAVAQESSGHPPWCTVGHECTAYTMPDGEHTSIPEIWVTEIGRVIATRHRRRDGYRNRVELRVVLTLDPREPIAAAQSRHFIAATHLILRKVFGLADGNDSAVT